MYRRIVRGIQNRLKSRSLYNQNRELLDRNVGLKNKFAGKRCFIIGNGSSILNQDLTKLANEETFVLNAFWEHPQYYQIKPKNYVVIDADSFPKDQNEYIKDEFLKREKEMTALPTRFLLNVNAFDVIAATKNFSKSEAYYLCLNNYFDEKLKFNIEIEKLIPNVKNVTLASIIIAAYMGFEKIYLLGCDHDFAAYPFPDYHPKHFYEIPKFDVNNPQERRYYSTRTTGSYEAVLDSMKTLFKNYRLVKNKLALAYPKLEIYNATPNSFLDVFPKVKYEEIL